MKKSEMEIIKITDTQAQEIKTYLGVYFLGFSSEGYTCQKSTLIKLKKAKKEAQKEKDASDKLEALLKAL